MWKSAALWAAYEVGAYLLRRTEKFAVESAAKLVWRGVRRLSRKRNLK
jgi:hypothetical protein